MLGDMADAAHHSRSGKPSRMRVIGARALTVVAILLALVGMLAFYVEYTPLDDEGFETISRDLIENERSATKSPQRPVDRLFSNVDVEAAIAEELPAAQQGLAPVLAGLARSGAYRAARRRSSGRVCRRSGWRRRRRRSASS